MSKQTLWPRKSSCTAGYNKPSLCIRRRKSLGTLSPLRRSAEDRRFLLPSRRRRISLSYIFGSSRGNPSWASCRVGPYVLLQLLWAFLNASVCKRCPPPLGLRRPAGCCCLISAVAPELDVTGYIDGRAAAAGTLASPADHLKSLMNSAAKLASQLQSWLGRLSPPRRVSIAPVQLRTRLGWRGGRGLSESE